jgi:hypothetical protein
MGELLVLLVCWKSGPYGVPDQQGDTTKTSVVQFATVSLRKKADANRAKFANKK